MRNIKGMFTGLLLATPLLAQASCESVQAGINQKIINNGAPATGFTLEVVPNDQVEKTGGQVVGHCENDSQKIVYKRNNIESDSSLPASAGSSQDAPAQ